MFSVPAAQMIYTRVERRDSPRRVSGFQTLFHSADGFTAGLLEEAESQLVFDAAPTVESKLVYCRVGEERFLIAQLTRIADRDDAGRQGNFIAHALVFSQENFVRLGANPLRIARHFRFCESLSEAMRLGDWKTGHLPTAQVTVREGEETLPASVKPWQKQELCNLLLLAASSEALRRDGQSVAIIGAPGSVCRVLEIAFALLPKPLRCRLSFSSHGQSPSRTAALWAQGYTSEPNRPGILLVDADRCRAEPIDDARARSSYAAWLKCCLRDAGIERAAEVGEQAWSLCELIDHGVWCEAQPAKLVDRHLAEQVWRVNAPRAKTRLVETASQAAGRVLAQRIVSWLLEALDVPERFAAMAGVGQDQVVRALRSAYRKLPTAPRRSEQEELRRFLERIPDAALRIWLAAWKKDGKELGRLLAQCSDTFYEQIVGDLCVLETLDLLRLYIPGRGERFSAAIARRGHHRRIDVVQVVQCLIKRGEAHALDRLVPLIAQQPARQIARLERLLLRAEVKAPTEFVAAVLGASDRPACSAPSVWKRLFS